MTMNIQSFVLSDDIKDMMVHSNVHVNDDYSVDQEDGRSLCSFGMLDEDFSIVDQHKMVGDYLYEFIYYDSIMTPTLWILNI